MVWVYCLLDQHEGELEKTILLTQLREQSGQIRVLPCICHRVSGPRWILVLWMILHRFCISQRVHGSASLLLIDRLWQAQQLLQLTDKSTRVLLELLHNENVAHRCLIHLLALGNEPSSRIVECIVRHATTDDVQHCPKVISPCNRVQSCHVMMEPQNVLWCQLVQLLSQIVQKVLVSGMFRSQIRMLLHL